MTTTLFATIVLSFAVLCIANGQYFSSSDGVNLPRSGKRSYLTSLLKQDPPSVASSLSSNQPINLDGPRYYQTDKLSFRKFLSKLGKRSYDDNQYYPSLGERPALSNYFVDRSAHDYLTKEILLNYLYNELHKLNRNKNIDLSSISEIDDSNEEK